MLQQQEHISDLILETFSRVKTDVRIRLRVKECTKSTADSASCKSVSYWFSVFRAGGNHRRGLGLVFFFILRHCCYGGRLWDSLGALRDVTGEEKAEPQWHGYTAIIETRPSITSWRSCYFLISSCRRSSAWLTSPLSVSPPVLLILLLSSLLVFERAGQVRFWCFSCSVIFWCSAGGQAAKSGKRQKEEKMLIHSAGRRREDRLSKSTSSCSPWL